MSIDTRRLLVEERLFDREHGVPLDFNFFVFDGEVGFIQVDMGRFSKHRRRVYDAEWNVQLFVYQYPLAPKMDEPPRLDEMKWIAEAISRGFDFARVDLYLVDGERVVFGEVTLAPGSGGDRFTPRAYDFRVGSRWSLDTHVEGGAPS